MNIIHCPKFLRALPFCIRTCIIAFVRGSASGEGGEFGAFGNALVFVSAFKVTMNCSFNASYQLTMQTGGSYDQSTYTHVEILVVILFEFH